MEGSILRGIGSFYTVLCDADGQEYTLRAQKKLRHQKMTPMVGDRVRFTPGSGEEHGWVEEILPRDSELIRPPVANIRHIVLVVAPQPAPDFLLIDTLIVMSLKQGIQPAIVVNKCDLDEGLFDQIAKDYAGLNVPVLKVSAKTGEGIGAWTTWLESQVRAWQQ